MVDEDRLRTVALDAPTLRVANQDGAAINNSRIRTGMKGNFIGGLRSDANGRMIPLENFALPAPRQNRDSYRHSRQLQIIGVQELGSCGTNSRYNCRSC